MNATETMDKVNEQRIKLRIDYANETQEMFEDNIPKYADWLENKLASLTEQNLNKHGVSNKRLTYTLAYCETCVSMTNHVCARCQAACASGAVDKTVSDGICYCGSNFRMTKNGVCLDCLKPVNRA